jgi:thioredoxin 1
MRDTTFGTFKADTSRGKVLVDCYATWCAPCTGQKMVLADLERSNPEVGILLVDVEKEPDLASQFGVRALPTILVFRDGAHVDTLVGVKDKAKLLSALEG